jgi:hypothetical protein
MPGFDHTGPNGEGAMTGRKKGICVGNRIEDLDPRPGRRSGRGPFRGGGFGRGLRFRAGAGYGEGYGRSLADDEAGARSEIEALHKRIDYLEDKLKKLKGKS